MPHGPVEILIPEILEGKKRQKLYLLSKASTLQDLGTGTLGEISIITFLTTAKPAQPAEQVQVGDFGNRMEPPLKKLVKGNCSHTGIGRQVSGSTDRQGTPASKKAAMCPF